MHSYGLRYRRIQRSAADGKHFGLQRARFYCFFAAGGILKMPSGTLLMENRGRWTLFHMSTGRDAAQFSNEKNGRPDKHDSTVTMPRTRAGSAHKSER